MLFDIILTLIACSVVFPVLVSLNKEFLPSLNAGIQASVC